MESTQVEIFGQRYNLKSMDDPGHIRELAAFIDAKMKEVQKGTGTADPHRVAILTALTIADELYRLRERHTLVKKMTETRVERLMEITDAAE